MNAEHTCLDKTGSQGLPLRLGPRQCYWRVFRLAVLAEPIPYRTDRLPPGVFPPAEPSSLASEPAHFFKLSLSRSKREVKSGSLIEFCLDPHTASVLVNDPLHRGQSHSRAFEILPP